MIQSKPFELEKLKPLTVKGNILLEVAEQTNGLLSIVEKYGSLLSEEDKSKITDCALKLSEITNGAAALRESAWSACNIEYAVETLKAQYPDEYPDIDMVDFFKKTGLDMEALYTEVMKKVDHEMIREEYDDTLIAVLDDRLRELRNLGVLDGNFEVETDGLELK